MFEKREEHPSYGMASFSRMSGTTELYGSEFNHQHFMALRISHGIRSRDLARDWYSATQEIVEVWMSESQFVELITSPNMGSGVPCTLKWISGTGQIEPAPSRESMAARFNSEVKDSANKCVTRLRAAITDLEESVATGTIGKTKLTKIVRDLEQAARSIDDSIPFIEKQFGEAVEDMLSHARGEIEAHVSAMAMRIGIETMRLDAERSGPKLIEHAPEATEGREQGR